MKYDKTIKFLEKALKHFRDKRKSLMPKKRRYKATFTIRCKITGTTRKKSMIITTENLSESARSIMNKIIKYGEEVIYIDWLLLGWEE